MPPDLEELRLDELAKANLCLVFPVSQHKRSVKLSGRLHYTRCSPPVRAPLDAALELSSSYPLFSARFLHHHTPPRPAAQTAAATSSSFTLKNLHKTAGFTRAPLTNIKNTHVLSFSHTRTSTRARVHAGKHTATDCFAPFEAQPLPPTCAAAACGSWRSTT